MSLKSRWLDFWRPYLEEYIEMLKADEDVSYDEFKEIKKIYIDVFMK